LVERAVARKPVPVAEVLTEDICPGCSVGCAVLAASAGDTLLRVLPDTGRERDTLLCAKGRFYYTGADFAGCLKQPLVNNAETGFEEAVTAVKGKLCDISGRYGAGSIRVAVSPSLTDEELAAAVRFTGELGAELVTFMRKDLPPVSREDMIKNPDPERERFANEAGILSIKDLKYLNPSEPQGAEIKALVALGETPDINTNGLEFFVVTSRSARDADAVLPLSHPFPAFGSRFPVQDYTKLFSL
jgi:hypothetical protein